MGRLVVGMVLLLAAFARAESDALAKANLEMKVEDYPKAIAAYEAMIEDGHVSAEVYYNLGVALEKSGRVVDSALNYRRALVLDPGLRSASNNLALLAVDQGFAVRSRTWLSDVVAVVHPGWLQGLGAMLSWIGLGGLVVGIIGQKRRWLTVGGLVAAVTGGGLFAMGVVADPRVADANLAVVTRVGGTDALTGPAKNSSSVDQLAAGSAVGVLSLRGAWTYVELVDGAKGWVAADSLTMVVPEAGL